MDSKYFCRLCERQSDALLEGLCAGCARNQDLTTAPTPNHESATIPPGEPRQPSFNVGQVGDYELLEEIARGGMGVVFKARHVKLNRLAAVKMILAGRFSSDEELQRFQLEAESAARLDHPGIVPIYDIGESDGQAYFAMKYIDGGSLSSQIRQFQQQPHKVAEIVANISEAIFHAHQRGILHRDLKPANILMDDDQPVVTDLGLAKSTSGGSDLTHTGAVLGTPSYMPPEQAKGNTVTTACDIYSIGAILYEFLAGQPPHQGESSMDVLMKVMEAEIVPPHKINPEVERDLELICLKCLKRDEKDRYSTAQQISDDLRAWLQGNSISVSPPSFFDKTKRWCQQNRKALYVLFAICAALPGCVILFLGFLSGNVADVYDHFPDEDRPLIFWVKSFPRDLANAGSLFFVFAIWPVIGFLNAILTKPKTLFQATSFGIATSLAFSVLFYLLVGWLIISLGVRNVSRDRIDVLTQAVWPPDEVNPEEAQDAADKMFNGLQSIPDTQKANIVRDRIVADSFAVAPVSLSYAATTCLVLSLPIVVGTIIAYLLFIQGGRMWLIGVRYYLALLALFIIGLIVYSSIVTWMSSGSIASNDLGWRIVIIAGLAMLAFLSLRNWKRSPIEKLESA